MHNMFYYYLYSNNKLQGLQDRHQVFVAKTASKIIKQFYFGILYTM